MKEVDILAIGVHPDDVELSCVGTLLKHIDMGYSVGLCDLTQGELGTRGSAAERLVEASNSQQLMGAQFRVNLGLEDGFIKHDKETIIAIARVIRQCKPQIVFANSIDDRHPDHGRAAKIAQDACFYSGLAKIEILDMEGNILPPTRPKAVYHYIQDRNLIPDFVVDITPYFKKKMECILQFKTQFYSGPEDNAPATPISGADFIEFIDAKNRALGRDIQATYAEGFKVARTMGVNDVFSLI